MPDKIFYFDLCMCEESNAVDGGSWLYIKEFKQQQILMWCKILWNSISIELI